MNISIDEIRTAMKEEYEAAKTAVEKENPELPPGAVAAALEDQGWRHMEGSIGSSMYGYHPPAQTGGYSAGLVHTDCVAIQYALGSPIHSGLVVVKI